MRIIVGCRAAEGKPVGAAADRFDAGLAPGWRRGLLTAWIRPWNPLVGALA
jgi:hypothetical protein